VLIVAVAGIDDSRDPALGIIAGPFAQRPFAYDCHLVGSGQVQGHGQAGKSAADDDDIKFHCFHFFFGKISVVYIQFDIIAT
jgi:hypothetical protein